MSVIERFLRREQVGSLVIDDMCRRDLRRGIREIEDASHPKPWSQNVFISELDQMRKGSRHYVAARSQREIVGYAGLWFAADEAHVTNVAVRPDRRRSGVATQLMLVLADVAIERECTAWTLEVRVSGTGAQELYRRFGFAPAGVRKRYYENSEDAIVMWCHDIQSASYRDTLDGIGRETAQR
ncbi:MAG: ribosomal protein S18-alanine N-acetyltransferase [Acidimicrobiia bacterium]|nr:ribosomal protein S18-alanine N-acetyltransferase [Acidimicrobiia bacterium]